MKKNWKSISLLLMLALAACEERPKQATVQQQDKQQVFYTCPMHPQVHENYPGNCPICGMTLIKKAAQASEGAGISLQTVLQPVSASVISGIAVTSPVEQNIIDTVHASGYLAFDTRTYNNIAARFSGRIEKLYIRYAFQDIHKGQHVMDVYSPEMVTAQQDLLFLLKQSPDETALIGAAKQKLLLLGMTEMQINQLIKTGKAFYSLPVYSTYAGHVHDVAHSQMAGSTNNEVTDYSQNMPLAIKEGMFIQKGQTLFNVVDPHRLWAVLKIRQADAGKIRLNQPVSLSIPDQEMEMDGKVDFIEPILQADDRSTSIRVYLNNREHGMKVGSLVRGEVIAGSKAGQWLPQTAVVNLGQTRLVWLKEGVAFRARAVKTGIQTAEQIQVISGLNKQDSVAVNAEYLSDSDSFIKVQGHE